MKLRTKTISAGFLLGSGIKSIIAAITLVFITNTYPHFLLELLPFLTNIDFFAIGIIILTAGIAQVITALILFLSR